VDTQRTVSVIIFNWSNTIRKHIQKVRAVKVL